MRHDVIERYELGWMGVSVVLVVLLFVGVLASMISDTLPGVVESRTRFVDPAHLETTAYAKPGLHEENGELHAYVVARAFTFTPSVLTIPAGRRVTFHFTAADVLHGVQIEGSNINFELIPGHEGVASATFRTPGTYTSACNEYCGAGHQNMAFKLIVENAK
ncbi:hypothetical protein [Deinococcus pimensis]|uniref:hypothetical protein n=1 Tax=Deinococcus pimensis TaxID=309888 RepID=UPI000481D11B|nr:hypothetical protein [Deinococcus pimensis]